MCRVQEARGACGQVQKGRLDQVAKYFYCVAQNFKLEWTMGAFGKVLTHELYFKSSNCEGQVFEMGNWL